MIVVTFPDGRTPDTFGIDDHRWHVTDAGVLIVEGRQGGRWRVVVAYAPGVWLDVRFGAIPQVIR